MMKVKTKLYRLLPLLLLGACMQTGPELGEFGVDLTNRDLAVKPGDDFFRYANGSWLKTFQMPADEGRYGAFNALRKRSDDRVKAIILGLADSVAPAGSMEQKIGAYYASFMDTAALNAKGIEPLRPGLVKIAAIGDVQDLTRAFGRHELDSTPTPLGFYVGADRNNPDQHELNLFAGGLRLGDRDDYLLDGEREIKIRQEYLLHIARMLDFAGLADSASQAQAVLRIETELAGYLWPRSEQRNRDLTFNPMSYADFKATYPGVDWDVFFKAGDIEGLERLNVSYPSAMAPVIQMLSSVPLADWKSYLSFRLISANAGILSEAIDAENFHFFSTVVNNVPTQKERWERGVARVGSRGSLGFALGKLYVAKFFPEAAKREMQKLVENLRAALADSIVGLDWMGEETKAQAILKLRAFRPKIGYPRQWKDLSGIEIIPGDLFASVQSIRAFNHWDSVNRLGEATDREEWGMTPQTINAYYNPSFNEIVFPAAILQPPFFDPKADLAVNYGGIGGVIGHEMGHGFDDQGSKSDHKGVQRNWWTDDDRVSFDKRSQALVAQYDAFEPLPGNFVNGSFTLGENIGDLGGLSIAYRAYHKALGGKPAKVIDGLTGDQRFFLSWAQVWCSKNRDHVLLSRLKGDPHSPEEYRVNGIVCNMDAWYEAFDVQPGDALYKAPADRIRIW